jgi:hypothetical protein
MFCAPVLIFFGTEGVASRFHVLRARTRFRRYRGRQVSFSCFPRPDSFSAVPKALGPVFMFSAVPRASGPVFIFCAPVLIFGGIKGVGSRFNVLCSGTSFRRFRGRRVSFSCFALPDSFSAVPRASGPAFMFCALGLVFDGTEDVVSRFHVFGGTDGVGSRFHVLRSWTRFLLFRGRRVPFSCFRRYRWRRVRFSYFARPYSFSAVLRASIPVFMFCAPVLIFGGTVCVGSHFHVLRSRTLSRR